MTPASIVVSPNVIAMTGFSNGSIPKRLNVYWAATSARLAMTMTSATMITQPVIQPILGPMARVTQVKLVPQSGSARFM